MRQETSNAMPANLNFILKCMWSGRFLSLRITWPGAYKITCLCFTFLLIFHYFQLIFFSFFFSIFFFKSSSLSISCSLVIAFISSLVFFWAPYVKWGLHCLSHWNTDPQSKRNWEGLSEHHLLFLATWKNNKCKTVRSQQYCFNSIFRWLY